MEQQLYELLRRCTVRVSVLEKTGHGTGFFVAPGLILTCAHVVKSVKSTTYSVQVFWNDQLCPAQIIQSRDEDDLALLQVNLSGHPCVYLSEGVKLREQLCSYGYPDNYPEGDTITCEYEGWTKDRQALLKFKMGQVRPGMSGSPLLNMNTGYVCGIIKRSSDRDSALGGRAIPSITVFRAFPELAIAQQKFHQQDSHWTRYLDVATGRPRQLTDPPRNYIPFPRNPLFQPRPGEFEQLEYLLFKTGKEKQPPRIGLVGIGMVGMGGIGKTQLAIEFAYRYQYRFPGGVFWMSAIGTNGFDWHRPLAELAFNTEYLPLDDDVSNSENELRRAQHFCRYLAKHNDALLVLDNVEDPNLVISALPPLAGGELTCAILYTSRNKIEPNGVITYQVEQLPEEGAVRLLLEGTRPLLLSEVLSGRQGAEAHATRIVCQGVGYLPLALVHLRGLLVRDQNLKLARLAEVLEKRGALDITKTLQSDATPLFATFYLSWESVHDEKARALFKLASYFPETALIPLWLLGLAAGLGESGDIFEPLGEARMQLQELSLMEELSDDQVRLHPLVREFGRRLVEDAGDQGKALLQEAGERLNLEFTDINKLEHRSLRIGYLSCLDQVQAALTYLELLAPQQVESLKRLEQWMDRESYLLGDKGWWPERIPGLFYQQFFNRSVEEDVPIQIGGARSQWLQQKGRIGEDNQLLIRLYSGRTIGVMGVAFSPDGNRVLTVSDFGAVLTWDTKSGKQLAIFEPDFYCSHVAFSLDGEFVLMGSLEEEEAYVFEVVSGKQLAILRGHAERISSVAFSLDGTKVLTGSSDGTARVWETANAKLLMTLSGHTKDVTSVALSPDGTKVLTGSSDQTVRVWEATSGKLLRIWHDDLSEMTSAAISPDSSKALVGFFGGTVRLWEISSGKSLVIIEEHMGPVQSVAFSPDGRLILTGSSDLTARLWETVNGKQLAILEGHTGAVRSVAFSPDGRQVLTGSSDGTARLWKIPSGKPNTYSRGYISYIESMTFSPDGKHVLTGSHDGRVQLWETSSGGRLKVLEGHTDQVRSVAFSPDGRQMLTGSRDGTARLWDARSGKQLTTLKGHNMSLTNVAFSPNGSQVLTGSYDGTANA